MIKLMIKIFLISIFFFTLQNKFIFANANHLSLIPNDTKCIVFEYLQPRDFQNLRQTNRAFYYSSDEAQCHLTWDYLQSLRIFPLPEKNIYPYSESLLEDLFRQKIPLKTVHLFIAFLRQDYNTLSAIFNAPTKRIFIDLITMTQRHIFSDKTKYNVLKPSRIFQNDSLSLFDKTILFHLMNGGGLYMKGVQLPDFIKSQYIAWRDIERKKDQKFKYIIVTLQEYQLEKNSILSYVQIHPEYKLIIPSNRKKDNYFRIC